MKVRLYIFKTLKKTSLWVKCFIDYAITWFKFFCLCEKYHNFKTKGVPFIDVSAREKCFIHIGKNFKMNNGMAGNQIGFGETPCVLRAVGGNIIIGDNVGISQAAILALANVIIGDNVLLGSGVKIYTSDFHPLDYKSRRCDKTNVNSGICAPVVIENDCFIGAGTIILKGVTIGAKSIVGAGSVVTKSIPPNEIWAGNPAKMIKRLPQK